VDDFNEMEWVILDEKQLDIRTNVNYTLGRDKEKKK